MKLIVNCSNLRSGGALQVAWSFLEEAAAQQTHQLHVLLSPEMARLCAEFPPADNIEFHSLDAHPTSGPASLRRFIQTAKSLEERIEPDAVLTLFGPSFWKPRAPHLCGYAACLHLFPKSFFIRKVWPKGLWARWMYRRMRRLSLNVLFRNSDALWVETAAARDSLLEAGYSPPIHIIGNTVSRTVREALGRVSREDKPEGVFRLLTVSAPHPNKHVEFIARLLPLFPEGVVQFQVTLQEEEFQRIFSGRSDHPAICNLGVLHPKELAQAMINADAAFLPSLLEVESAAYYEALLAGLPVIASDLPFARAQCGEAAFYYAPLDEHAAAATIRQLIENPQVADQLKKNGRSVVDALPPPERRTQELLRILGTLAHK